jgi:hypothetical protein
MLVLFFYSFILRKYLNAMSSHQQERYNDARNEDRIVFTCFPFVLVVVTVALVCLTSLPLLMLIMGELLFACLLHSLVLHAITDDLFVFSVELMTVHCVYCVSCRLICY